MLYRLCKYSITPSQEVGRIPPRQQRVGSDEAICACNAGGGFCAVRQAQLSAHPFGCSRGKPWGHLSTCGESDKPAQALGGVGRFRCSHLWGGLGEGWQCHQDRPSQLGSALWRHLPGQERVVYLPNADKYRGLTHRLLQEQKGLVERALTASQRPSHAWRRLQRGPCGHTSFA